MQVWAEDKVVLWSLFLGQYKRQEKQDMCTWTLAGGHLQEGVLLGSSRGQGVER
jgi:hypothetical protein